MSRILDRYPRDGIAARLYRRLRLRLGGLRALAAHFPADGLIVDLGCGMGLFAHVLVEAHPERRVLAVDHDPGRAALLKQSAEGLAVEARCGDMLEVDVPPCGGVALIDVLHYFEADPQESLLARAVAALESGGVLVMRDPDASAGLRYGLARWHEALAIGTGWTAAREGRYRGAADWRALLEAFGLAVQVLPLARLSPYADRVLVGRKP